MEWNKTMPLATKRISLQYTFTRHQSMTISPYGEHFTAPLSFEWAKVGALILGIAIPHGRIMSYYGQAKQYGIYVQFYIPLQD